MRTKRLAAAAAVAFGVLIGAPTSAFAQETDYKQKCVKQTLPGATQPPVVCVLWLLDV